MGLYQTRHQGALQRVTKIKLTNEAKERHPRIRENPAKVDEF